MTNHIAFIGVGNMGNPMADQLVKAGKEVKTFDVYEGENIPKDKKSVAINVTLQAFDKTLTENDLDQISRDIIAVVSEKTGATIRS